MKKMLEARHREVEEKIKVIFDSKIKRALREEKVQRLHITDNMIKEVVEEETEELNMKLYLLSVKLYMKKMEEKHTEILEEIKYLLRELAQLNTEIQQLSATCQ